jgi:hypothetical protein
MKLHHPLWTHTPAFALWLAAAVAFARGAALPGPWPTHWNLSGRPDNYAASWWEFPFIALSAGVVLLVIGAAADGLWAQYENGRKRFNPFVVIDELGLAAVFACALGYEGWLRHHPQPLWQPPALVALVLAVAAALALEIVRPAGPILARDNVDTTALVHELEARQAAGQRWVYWSEQAPLWIRLMIAVPIGLVVMFVVVPPPTPARFLLLASVPLVLLGGGFRTQVTRAGLEFRIGWGPRLLRLPPAEIASAEVCEFNPMRDFGGWGLRPGRLAGRWTWGYYLEGNTGVLIRTTKDKSYLIGTCEPERLLAVINVARGAA